jgi:UDPglucose 6-dehydrogenase
MQHKRVGVIGGGPVGLVTATILASWGTRTALIERDDRRLHALEAGKAPFFEPGLDEVLKEQLENEFLVVGGDLSILSASPVTFICVGTPPGPDGTPDLEDLERATANAAEVVPEQGVVAIKSTVPPGTTSRLNAEIAESRHDIFFVSCPEFLREGQALYDMRSPSRVVVGGIDPQANKRVADLFAPSEAPVIFTSPTGAELIKYGSNAFLATKISFVNELANLCDLVGADVTEVANGIGADPRIGHAFLNAGLGFGGSCFPKDVRGLEEAGTTRGYTSWLLKACTDINAQQRYRFAAKIRSALSGSVAGSRIAVLGLSFKPGTDDLRQAPALDIVRSLQRDGAHVVATDPVAILAAASMIPEVDLIPDPYECVRDADALVLATEWPEYLALNWARIRDLMRGNVILDGRNVLDRKLLSSLGFWCYGVGRPVVPPSLGDEQDRVPHVATQQSVESP